MGMITMINLLRLERYANVQAGKFAGFKIYIWSNYLS